MRKCNVLRCDLNDVGKCFSGDAHLTMVGTESCSYFEKLEKPKAGQVWEVDEDIFVAFHTDTSLRLITEYDHPVELSKTVEHCFTGYVIDGEHQGLEMITLDIGRLIRRIPEAE